MIRLANSSRVAADSGPAASVLPDALSNFHAVSNAAAKRSFVSGSKVVFASSGTIDNLPLLTGGSPGHRRLFLSVILNSAPIGLAWRALFPIFSDRRHEHTGSPRAGSAKSAFARKAREVGKNRGN